MTPLPGSYLDARPVAVDVSVMITQQQMPTALEIRDIIAESAAHQLASIAGLLTSAGIDVAALARAIGGGASMLIAMRVEIE